MSRWERGLSGRGRVAAEGVEMRDSEGYPEVRYAGIAAVTQAPNGALRLYRRRRFLGLLRQDVFHPAGEWWAVRLTNEGWCYVLLRSR